MKGYTKIELTNIHTGEKEVVEKHNIITNNLNELYKTYLMANRQSDYFTVTDPLYTAGMGGIILFSNQLTENANNYGMIFNSADDIVGCAGDFVNSSTNKMLGSKNMTESKLIDNGYKYVWDFGTSQANGTIAAVGLTNYLSCRKPNQAYAAPHPVAQFYSSSNSSVLNCYGLGKYQFSNVVSYDFNNNTFVAVNLVSGTEIKFTVYKIDMNTQHILPERVYKGSKKIIKVSETTVNIPVELHITYGNVLDGFDGYYYYVEHPNYTTLKLARISKTDFKYDSEYGLKNTVYDSKLLNNMNTGAVGKLDKIANGYLYTRTYIGSSTLQKIKLSDPTKHTGITIPTQDYNSNYNVMASNGKCIYLSGNIIFPDDSVRHYSYYTYNPNSDDESIQNYFCTVSSMGYSDCILISPDSSKFVTIPTSYNYAEYMQLGIGYFFNSLNTINNLSSSVVKTADKTMKITYTITEGE